MRPVVFGIAALAMLLVGYLLGLFMPWPPLVRAGIDVGSKEENMVVEVKPGSSASNLINIALNDGWLVREVHSRRVIDTGTSLMVKAAIYDEIQVFVLSRRR
jgi:hypothetical protein